MAKNGVLGKSRIGAIKNRTQLIWPNGNWIKRDSATGRIIDQNKWLETL
ncbi:hypothetical protein [Falsibacillus pallidus]|uniref:Uncharacterized protein n=1 Tax=Falsibacillus pallidus TaxID=493781 RepID=A0A370G3V7_9BACI|nr:hypothetical protein [Falsibacillus pallidus]RDI37529.1 hypothetical protein DFR59_12126 [Falsibacillus pallidus]